MRVFLGLDIQTKDVVLYQALEIHLKDIFSANKIVAYFKEEGQFHLTLQYLGDLTEVQAEKIDFLDELAKSFAETKLIADVASAFWSADRADKLFLRVCEDPKLHELATRVNKHLKARGFVVDERPFIPHITIAKFARPYNIFKVLKQVSSKFHSIRFQTENINVYKSAPSSSGSNYQILQSAKLAAPNK